MKLVIEIPDTAYNAIMTVKDIESTNECLLENVLFKAIENGTPLPKGHGDLIDRSKIAFDYWSVDGHVCVWKQNIFNMLAVVPADKEG